MSDIFGKIRRQVTELKLKLPLESAKQAWKEQSGKRLRLSAQLRQKPSQRYRPRHQQTTRPQTRALKESFLPLLKRDRPHSAAKNHPNHFKEEQSLCPGGFLAEGSYKP